MRYGHFSLLPIGAFEPRAGRSGPMRLHGGGGDGGGSSSTTSTTTSTQNVDRRQVVDNGAVGITSDGGQVSITSTPTDYGAIAAAGQAIDNALFAGRDMSNTALFAVREAGYNAVDTTRAIADQAMSGVLAAAAASGSASEKAFNTNSAALEKNYKDNAAALKDAYSKSGAAAGDAYASASDYASTISGRAFDLASTSSAAEFKTIEAALGFTKDVLNLAGKSADLVSSGVNNAYTTAQDTATGARYVMTIGLAIAGILLVWQLPKLKGA